MNPGDLRVSGLARIVDDNRNRHLGTDLPLGGEFFPPVGRGEAGSNLWIGQADQRSQSPVSLNHDPGARLIPARDDNQRLGVEEAQFGDRLRHWVRLKAHLQQCGELRGVLGPVRLWNARVLRIQPKC